MADESTDVSSKEELSVCARWVQNGKPVEHFLGIVQAKETTAEAITRYLCSFLEARNIDLNKMCGLGFDDANTMAGHRTGVQTQLRLYSLVLYTYTAVVTNFNWLLLMLQMNMQR